MNTLMILLIATPEADPSFGFMAGLALIVFAMLLGLALLLNGWPRFGKK